ncbi:hypothetical protein [Rhodobacter capsulatus]|uniref:hypothetical protein n=1 Tax=Rhodobacter capsulatus TaxID=1061 RepID=UPI0040292FB4
MTAKALSGKYKFSGQEWFYNFRELHKFCEGGKTQKHLGHLFEKYSKITKDWNPGRNSEWICRVFLSAKMILSATLQLEALAHARKQNLRIVAPYLEYYTLLALLRAVIYTLPEIEWEDGKLAAISHTKAINLSVDYISKFNREKACQLKELTLDLKANRELISYRSPSSGDENIIQCKNIIEAATILAEFAQMNSEVLEKSILKNSDRESSIFLENFASQLSHIKIEGRHFFDKEDSYRLGYLARKHPLPTNIMHIMTEGHVEDFFGAWCAEEGDERVFDPDDNWRLIFDVP